MVKGLFVFIFFVMLSALPADARRIEGIAAIVNDDVITYSELQARTRPFMRSAENMESEDFIGRVRERELRTLIEERLISGKARELGIGVSDEDVEDELDEVKARFPAEESFLEFLREQRLTAAVLRERLKARLLLGKLAEAEIMPGVQPPSREAAKSFYDENPGLFTEPGQQRLSRILIAAGDEASLAAAERKIKEIKIKISGGGDFGLLAKEHSDGAEASEGGDVGFVSRAEILPEIWSAVAGLSPGDVSGVVRTDEGFSIFKVTALKGSRQMEFGEVENAVSRHLFQLKMEEAVGVWLEKVKSGAYIEVRGL